ncbi:MAG: DUF1638 domain-containing protein [Candidatus Promineifilaceae bacterium]
MTTGLIICGALAREVIAIVKKHNWDAEIAAVSAMDHVFPDRIAPDVEKRILELRAKYARLIVVYGDCGSRGALDMVLNKYNIERLEGPHCYDWFGGKAGFHDLMDEEPGTFFLTDYIVRAYRGMIMKGMGLDKYPELKVEYFRHYKRLVYLVQKPEQKLIERARAISDYLSLPLEIRATGYNGLESQLVELMA